VYVFIVIVLGMEYCPARFPFDPSLEICGHTVEEKID
jgi:hypothetical protein